MLSNANFLEVSVDILGLEERSGDVFQETHSVDFLRKG